jgi:hypothetical protein
MRQPRMQDTYGASTVPSGRAAPPVRPVSARYALKRVSGGLEDRFRAISHGARVPLGGRTWRGRSAVR